MRRKIRILTLAAIVASVIVPFGFALSNESPEPPALAAVRTTAPVGDVVASAAPVLATSTMIAVPQFSEGAKLFAIGTFLFGLAAVMRRNH